MARRRPARHLWVTLALLGLCVPGLGYAAVPATAAGLTDGAAASANSTWLAGELEDGAVPNPMNPDLPDHGLMIDIVLAMYASGDGALAEPIVTLLDDKREARRYFTYFGFGEGQDWLVNEGLDDRVGGATAKVLVAALTAGRNPRAFGGYDMVKETLDVITPSGPEKGRVRDFGPTTTYNNANTFGQALAVIGLAGARANNRSAVDMLTFQQCREGYFRIFYSYDTVTQAIESCDAGKATGFSAPDRDSTGIGLSALLAAKRAGATGLQDAIDRASAWLVSQQTDGGGWGGGVSTEAPNTNSTGLVVQALADAGGHPTSVSRGAAYLRAAQVVAADKDTELKGEVGAIAYTPDDYRGARTAGFGGRDTWIRASAQASLGLSRASFWALVTGQVPQSGKPKPPRPEPVKPTPKPTPKPTRPSTPTKPSGPGRPAAPRPPAPPAPLPPGGSPGTRTPVASPKPLVEQGSPTPAGRLGRYLASHLVDGDHVEVKQGASTYVDYDATAETVFALRALGEQPAAVRRASAFLTDARAVTMYVSGAPYEKGRAVYAEPAAKTLLIALMAQRDGGTPSAAAAVTLLRGELAALQSPDGTFADTGQYADRSETLRRHVWATLALTAVGKDVDASRAVDLLTQRQCADGGFAPVLATRHCATGDPTATGWAAMALGVVAMPAATAQGTVKPVALSDALAGTTGAESWSAERRTALSRTVTALRSGASSTGVVTDGAGHLDLAATSAVVAGGQVAGLDGSATARTVGALVNADGGLAATAGRPSDAATSLLAAPAVAGRSWLASTAAPVAGARLQQDPPTAAAAPVAPARSRSAAVAVAWWQQPAVLGAALAAALLLGGLAGALTRRRTSRVRP